MSTSYKTVAVIPCLNEEKNIFDIVQKTSKFVDMVLVINDGSSDNTEYEAKRAGAAVISHHRNLGKGAALNTAFDFLRKSHYNAAVFLDGDGQHDPNEIPKILEPVISGQADMVIGSRFLYHTHKIPFYRRIGQRILNVATNLGSNVIVTDSQSGFRCFSLKAIKIIKFTELGLSVESEMQFIAGRNELLVSEVPIKAIYNDKPRRNPVKHGFGVLIKVFLLTGRQLLSR